MTGSAPLLEVSGLDVAYGEARVLFDVSLTVHERQIVTCVGRNGAGKTTLLKCVAGFVAPGAGEIRLRDESLLGRPAHALARKGVRYIPQDKKVFSDLTVRENLELGAYAAGVHSWDRALGYFPRLATLMERKAGHLSGGERQMLMIGRAILGNPQLLLIDEPTEGLAPSIVTQLQAVFRNLAESTALVIVEQNLPLVCAISDKVYALREGRIVTAIEDRAALTPELCEQYV